MEQQKLDFFLNSVPSNVSEDDVKQSLRAYNIGVRSCRIRERTHDHTRFAFLSVYNQEEFEQLLTLRELNVKGHKIPIKVCKERSKDDEDNNFKAKISVLLSQANELGINMIDILTSPTTARCHENEVPSPSCVTFHAISTQYEQVHVSNSMKVDPTTNAACDGYEVQKNPLSEAKFDDVTQRDMSLTEIMSHYSTPDSFSSNLPQTFNPSTHPAPDQPIPQDTEPSDDNSILKSLHLDRSSRRRDDSSNSLGFSSLNDLSVSDTSVENYFTPPDTVNQAASSQPFTFKPTSKYKPTLFGEADPAPVTKTSNSYGTSPATPFIFGSETNISQHPKKTENSSLLSLQPARNVHNISNQGSVKTDKPKKSQELNDTPLSVGIINTPQTFSPVSPLMLRPIISRRGKADIPYEFRYLVSEPGVLDCWFEESAPLDDLSESSPMSVEETFGMIRTDELERTADLYQCQLSTEIERSLNLEPVQSTHESHNNPAVNNTDWPDISSSLMLLALFKSELETMSETKYYAEFEGISLQVSHIFQEVIEQDIISQSVIDMDTCTLRELITKTEQEVSEIQELIDSLSAEEDKDIVDDLTNDNLSEATEKLREQRADFLLLQIVNVLEHERAMDNASNPSLMTDC